MGRKIKYDIDSEEVYKLATFHCSYKEIADFFGCSPDIIRTRFKDVIDKGKASTKQRLRRAQLETAIEDKNPTLLIWLGKQMLGQQDKKDVVIGGEVTNTLKVEFVTPQQTLINSPDIIDIVKEDIIEED